MKPQSHPGRPSVRPKPSWLMANLLGYNLYHTKQESQNGNKEFGNPGRARTLIFFGGLVRTALLTKHRRIFNPFIREKG